MSTESKEKPWLIMLYLAGDNNLSEEMVLALQDILDERVPAGDILVAQYDPSGIGLSTQRYIFESVDKGRQLENYRDKTFDGAETNSGSPEALASFMNWAWKQAWKKDPREEMNYLLILSGHGAGTSEDFLMKDENALDALSIPELKDAFRTAQAAEVKEGRTKKKINVLGMDACFMNMGEVAYEIREFADILVAAQGLEPSFGWPYRRILNKAKHHRGPNGGSAMTPKEVASAIVDEYIVHYSDYDRAAGRSADLSAILLNGPDDPLKGVALALRDLAPVLLKDHKKVLLAHWYAQTYKFDQYVDLVDFCKQMTEFGDPDVKFRDPEVAAACNRVIDAVNRCIITSGVTGFAYQYSRGFSIYFPWAVVSPDYDGEHLAFVYDSKWDHFLRAHVKATRRPARYPTTSTTDRGTDAQQSIEDEIFVKLMALTDSCCSAANRSTDQEQNEADSKNEILEKVSALKSACRRAGSGADGQGDDDEKVDEDIALKVRRLAGFLKLDPHNEALERGLRGVARAVTMREVPYRDLPREITRRLLRGTQFSGGKSRYDDDRYDDDRYDDDRYGAGTRFQGDRERAVKNLPPVIGKHLTPPKMQEDLFASESTIAHT